MTEALTIVPASKASWEDLQAILGTRGYTEVSRPTLRRVVMRIDFQEAPTPTTTRAPKGAT